MQCCGYVSTSPIISPLHSIKIKNPFPKLQALSSPQTQSPATKIPLPSHVNSITSTTNPFVKHCLKLRQSSSYRNTHNSVLVVGTIPIKEVCMFEENKTEIKCLLVEEEAKVPKELERLSVRVVRVSSLVMKKLCGMQSSESVEIIALMRMPSSFIDVKDGCKNWFPCAHRVLVLDRIQDPGNLGTLIRSAMAFNWDGAFLLPGCCDPFNDKALRASRGASFQLPIVSGDWNNLKVLEDEFQMKLLAGHPESTNSQKLKPVSKLSLEFAKSLEEKPLCLILGSEGHGLSEQSRKLCELVSIPMAGEFESLNVSVAGGIFLFMLQSCSGL